MRADRSQCRRALRATLAAIQGPKTITIRVNAGRLSTAHWLNDPVEGGGRLLGEGVHFIDFLCGMIDTEPELVTAQGSTDWQEFALTLRFADESLGTVIYTARGDVRFPKERVEAFAGGGVAVRDDFKTLTFSGLRGSSIQDRQDKGHRALLDYFGAALQGAEDLIVTGIDGLRATRIALAAMAVVAISGDGSAMYSIQSLWTAAHHDLAILFVILNNGEYRVLKHNLDAYRQRFGVRPDLTHPCMDLRPPDLGFVDLAKGLGVQGARVTAPGELGPALTRALSAQRPYLLDVLDERKA